MRLSAEPRSPGTDLVLLHGWGMNAAVWDGLPEAIVGARRATRIELPGHGASPFDPSWGDLSAWASACLDVAPERAVWLAWSLGGLVALDAALAASGRVDALILLTATPRFVQAPEWPAAMPTETLERFNEGLRADPVGTLHRFLALQVRGSEAGRETLRHLRGELVLRPAPDPGALAVGLDLLKEGDLRLRLPELACPSLWVFGGRDALVPAAVAGGVATLLAGARQPAGEEAPSSRGEGLRRGRPTQARHKFAVIPGAGHAPFLSHPLETADAVLSFLAEVER